MRQALAPQGQGLEHVQARAHAAVHQHRQVAADRLGDGGQGADGGGRAVELAPAVVGDHDPLDAAADRLARVLGIEHALEHDRTWPALAHPGDVAPGDRWVEVAADPAPEVAEALQSPAAAATLPRVCGRPPRLHVRRASRDGPGRRRPGAGASAACVADHAVARVAIARAGHRQVDGEQQHRTRRPRGPAPAPRP